MSKEFVSAELYHKVCDLSDGMEAKLAAIHERVERMPHTNTCGIVGRKQVKYCTCGINELLALSAPGSKG